LFVRPRTTSIASNVHEEARAGERLRLEQCGDGAGKFRRFEHAPHADFAARLIAARRSEDRDPVLLQLPYVAPIGRVLPHLAVHRWGDRERALAGKAECREEVVSEAVRHLREEVGGGRRDEDQILIPRERNVPHAVGHARVPHVRVHGMAGQGLHGRRRDEAAGRFGHGDVHFHIAFSETPDELCALVGRNAAGYAEQDFFSRRISHVALFASRAASVNHPVSQRVSGHGKHFPRLVR
jgi:hypothetical protein